MFGSEIGTEHLLEKLRTLQSIRESSDKHFRHMRVALSAMKNHSKNGNILGYSRDNKDFHVFKGIIKDNLFFLQGEIKSVMCNHTLEVIPHPITRKEVHFCKRCRTRIKGDM